MGGAHTRGRWRCGDSITAVAVMGGCHLDFRGAEIDTDEVRVTAIAVMGGIDIVVPEGVEVSMTGLPVMGGRAVRVKDVAPLPGAPRIVVHAFPIMGGVNVRSLPRHARDDAEPPPTQHDAAPGLEGTVTIMFSDLCGYSELTDRLGDRAALDLLREHNRIVRDQIVAHGGQEVKASGDGFMVAFSSVARSLRCASDLQRTLAERNRASRSEPIRVHIGIHAGEALRDGNDFLGGTVIVASRLADAAAPEEILVSSVARELADSSREFAFGLPRSVALKGFLDARQAYPLRWQPLDDVSRADRVG
jgi:class 3 adenylate cyclase